MKLFAQIQKVDEERRLVFGRAADETADKSGEMLNYDGSKPHFQKWSEEISKDTDGKSLGNVRAMHGKVAAGKLTEINFDDAAKAIDVCAKVVDDNEWKKVMEGVYTGFSIGGSYGAKTVEKIDDKDITRYIAIPSEISLVDRPCIPTAKFFEVQKADGTLAKVEFQVKESNAAPLDKVIGDVTTDAEIDAIGTVEGTPEQVDELTKVMAEGQLTLAQVIELAKVAARKDTNAEEGEKKYGDVTFADEKNHKYPLDTEEHVRAAASYWGMAKNKDKYSAEDQKTISAKIAAAEKKFKIGDDEASKAVTALLMKTIGAELRKGMYACAQFAQLIQSLSSLQESAEYEACCEGDSSPVPDKLAACVAMCGAVLKEMIDEELAELSEGGSSPEAIAVPMVMAEKCGNLAKYDGNPLLTLIKAGARNSAADKEKLNAIHDASASLGADCPMAQAEKTGELQKADEAALNKLIAGAVEPLQKALEEAKEQIKKLEAQPAAPRVHIRAVKKDEDTGENAGDPTEADLVKDDHGVVHPAASLIKQSIATGGQPLLMPYHG